MKNIETIKKLIEIKSFSEEENKEIVDYLISKFSPLGKEIIKVRADGSNRDNIIIGLNCPLKNALNAIILNGHIDTVVANEDEYQTNPYKGVEKDGKLYGLGVIDMKCFFASIIDNIEKIAGLSCPIIICITADEETSFKGIGRVCEELQRLNIKPRFTIVGEPTSLKICTCSKGDFEFSIDITGKGCHSSRPENGVNANYIAAKLISFIEKLNKKFKETTISCNIMKGGSKVNIVSDFANLTFEVRSFSIKTLNKIKSLINKKILRLQKEYVGCKISLIEGLTLPPLEEGQDKTIQNLIKKYSLEKGEFIGGCEAGYFQKLGGSAFLFGTGDLSLAHKPNEYMVIDDYFKYNELLLQLLSDLDAEVMAGK